MNLAQLIPPEWAQEGAPARFAPLRPAGMLPPMGIVRRDSDQRESVSGGYFGPRHTIEALEKAIERAQVKATMATTATRQAPRALAPVLSKGRGAELKRRSKDNLWPRGKRGDRLAVLKAIAGCRRARIGATDLHARLGSARESINTTCAVLRNLCRDGWLERSGMHGNYQYAISPLGRQALEAEG